MKFRIYSFTLLILLLINSYSILHAGESNSSKDWIPEIVDSTRRVIFPRPYWNLARDWRIETRNEFSFADKNGKIATIQIIKKDLYSNGFLGFYRLKECSNINVSFSVRYQENGNVADRFKIYWGEFKNNKSLPALYNFTILKNGHFQVGKSMDKYKPNWVCIHDGIVTNWNPASIYNVICIQQNGIECKISVNGGILIYTMLDSFEGVETGFDIFGSDSWEIKKIEFAE